MCVCVCICTLNLIPALLFMCVCVSVSFFVCVSPALSVLSGLVSVTAGAAALIIHLSRRSLSLPHDVSRLRACVSLLPLRLTALTDSRRFPQPVHTHTWTHTTNVSVMTAFTHFLCKKFLITIRPPGGTKTRTVLLH